MKKIETLHPVHTRVLALQLILSVILLLSCMLAPLTVQASTVDPIEDFCEPGLTIRNNGSCAVNIYCWKESGDEYHGTLYPGQYWRIRTYDGAKYRVVDLENDWSNLQYDESYMINGCDDHLWEIVPDYCPEDSFLCPRGLLANASFEDGTDGWQCVNGTFAVGTEYAEHGNNYAYIYSNGDAPQ